MSPIRRGPDDLAEAVPLFGAVAFLTVFLGIFRHVLSFGLYSGSFDQLIGLYLPGRGVFGLSHFQEGAAVGVLAALYGLACVPLAWRVSFRPLRVAGSVAVAGFGLLCLCVVLARHARESTIARELEGQRNRMARAVEEIDPSNPRMRHENEWTRRRFEELDAAWQEYRASRRGSGGD